MHNIHRQWPLVFTMAQAWLLAWPIQTPVSVSQYRAWVLLWIRLRKELSTVGAEWLLPADCQLKLSSITLNLDLVQMRSQLSVVWVFCLYCSLAGKALLKAITPWCRNLTGFRGGVSLACVIGFLFSSSISTMWSSRGNIVLLFDSQESWPRGRILDSVPSALVDCRVCAVW